MNWDQDFQQHLVEQGRSPRTIEAYLRMMRHYAAWYELARGKAFEPAQFVAPDLREYRTVRTQSDGAATWNLRLAAFRAFTSFATFKAWIHTDPLMGVLPMEQQVPAPKALTGQEFRDLRSELDVQINGASTDFGRFLRVRDRAIVALMAYSLLRSGEIVRLDVADVSIREKSGDVRIRHGKGDKEAVVPLGREARLAVSEWLAVHPGGQSLFPGKGTDRISQRELQRLARAIGLKCSIELWPHRLRHTGIHRLIHERGEPVATVQKLARHARAETTLRYAVATDEQMRLAAECL